MFFNYYGQKTKPRCGSGVNWSNSISRGMVACFLMNEGAGPYVANLAGRDVGLLSQPEWTDGPDGPVVVFQPNSPGVISFLNGGNDGRIVGAQQLTIITSISMKAGNTKAIADTTTIPTGVAARGWSFISNLVGGRRFLSFQQGFASNTNMCERVASPGSLLADTWFQVAVTYEGLNAFSGIHIYMNGSESNYDDSQSTDGVGDFKDPSRHLCIGNRFNGFRPFEGLMNYFYMWDRVLSVREIFSIYTNPYSIIYSFNLPIMSTLGRSAGPPYRCLMGVGV